MGKPGLWSGERVSASFRSRLSNRGVLAILALLVCPAGAQTSESVQAAAPPAKLTGFPFSADESLHYSINWPSGLSLGEAVFTAHRSETGWAFTATADAGIPAFPITDKFRSIANGQDLCSAEFERDTTHGKRKTREKTTFDQKKRSAHRTTVFPEGGGQSDFDIPSCARDALDYVYFARREMGQGRVPRPERVFFGSAYSVRMEYTGEQTISLQKKSAVTDRVLVSVKGGNSDFSFEIFFARDAARTPLLIRIPLSLATFSLELVR